MVTAQERQQLPEHLGHVPRDRASVWYVAPKLMSALGLAVIALTVLLLMAEVGWVG